jgi:putative PIN family toxin of toxin-antitoxin system
MIRVVLDTNVVVSPLLNPEGLQNQVLKLAMNGYVQLYISPAVLAEYSRVIRDRRFKFSAGLVRSFLGQVRRRSRTVRPMRCLSACSDEDDNRIVECADAAGADFLVTGNRRHFPAEWKRTSIVNGANFWN